MTESGPAAAQADVSIDADPATVYHLITDLARWRPLAEEARLTLQRLKEKAEAG